MKLLSHQDSDRYVLEEQSHDYCLRFNQHDNCSHFPFCFILFVSYFYPSYWLNLVMQNSWIIHCISVFYHYWYSSYCSFLILFQLNSSQRKIQFTTSFTLVMDIIIFAESTLLAIIINWMLFPHSSLTLVIMANIFTLIFSKESNPYLHFYRCLEHEINLHYHLIIIEL